DGGVSPVYARAARLLGQVSYDHTHELEIDAIGGLEVGAVPLTTAAVIAYDAAGQAMEGFWVRDKQKEHGTRKLVEGNLKPGARVVIVDDVITRGNSAVKAIKVVQSKGCEVILVLTLVDRLQGAKELFHAEGVKNYQSIFT